MLMPLVNSPIQMSVGIIKGNMSESQVNFCFIKLRMDANVLKCGCKMAPFGYTAVGLKLGIWTAPKPRGSTIRGSFRAGPNPSS